MSGILSAIGLLFGKLMYFIYNTIGFEHYALSLILFTLAYKLILLPLSIKQTKTTLKMQELQPELARIQERYKNDREKLNEETMKFYQEKKYNPSSGCLPMLIQLPILLALFYVIRMPMSYMLDIPAKAVGEMTVVSVESGDIAYGAVGKETFDQVKGDPTEVYKKFNQKDYYFEIKLFSVIDRKPEIVDNNQYLTEDQKTILKKFDLKLFNFFNLGIPPSFNELTKDPASQIPAFLMLLLAVVSTFFTTKLSMPPQPETNSRNKAKANPAANTMFWISPIMTLWIGLTTPSGLSFYWTVNNILSLAQQKALFKFFKVGETGKNTGNGPAIEAVNTGAKKEESSIGKDNNKRSKKH